MRGNSVGGYFSQQTRNKKFKIRLWRQAGVRNDDTLLDIAIHTFSPVRTFPGQDVTRVQDSDIGLLSVWLDGGLCRVTYPLLPRSGASSRGQSDDKRAFIQRVCRVFPGAFLCIRFVFYLHCILLLSSFYFFFRWDEVTNRDIFFSIFIVYFLIIAYLSFRYGILFV